MPGHSIKHRADGKFGGAIGFENQVLFAMQDGFGLGQVQELNTRVRHLGSDRFVTEIQTEPIGLRLADNAGEQKCGMKKIKL